MKIKFDPILNKFREADGLDPSVISRISTLENNEYKILYFEAISTATGTITKPTNSTILLDQFYGGLDAVVETLSNGQPTGQSPLTSGGAVVSVSSFDTDGDYTLSGTPASFDVALVYILKIKAIDYSNLTIDNIMAMDSLTILHEEISAAAAVFAPAANTSYNFGLNPSLAPATANTARFFGFNHNGILEEVVFGISTGNLASAEDCTLELRNITTATSYTIGIYQYDAGINGNKLFRYKSLSIPINDTDIYSVRFVTAATFSTAPTGTYHSARLKTRY
jgi:hypothetical protein